MSSLTPLPNNMPLPGGFRNPEPGLSKMRFFSAGIVAANKPLKSKEIEVTPVEQLTMLDGFLDDQRDTYDVKGQDANGQNYSSKLQMANSIKASWVPFGASNRLTAPDVRRGEMVMIYQFGDADKYYWNTLKADNDLRKLETVVWAFSATRDEGAKTDANHSYYFEVSTHKKIVALHTSQADGERWGYDVQIDADKGRVIITDTINNKILLDSGLQQVRLENAAGSYVDITKMMAKIFTGDSVEIQTTNFTVNCQTAVYNSPTYTLNGQNVQINGRSRIQMASPSLRVSR